MSGGLGREGGGIRRKKKGPSLSPILRPRVWENPHLLPRSISGLAHVSAQVGRPEGFDQASELPGQQTPPASPKSVLSSSPLSYSLPESPLQLGNLHHIGQRCP